jgi:hypothetical protein
MQHEYQALEQGETSAASSSTPRSYRNRIVSVVSIGLVIAGGAVMVANRHEASSSSALVTDLKASAAAPKGAKVAVLPEHAEAAPKKGAVAEKRGDEKDIDGGKPVSKKTAKPTFKPTLPPKPTMKPVTAKPQERKHSSHDEPKEREVESAKAPKVRTIEANEVVRHIVSHPCLHPILSLLSLRARRPPRVCWLSSP